MRRERENETKKLDYTVFVDAGWQKDLTDAVAVHCVYKIDNVFNTPNFKAQGFVCKTNTPNNTAFRGFGNPQAILAGEVRTFFSQNFIFRKSQILIKFQNLNQIKLNNLISEI